MSRSVAAEASFARTSPLSNWLDQGRWRRVVVIVLAILAAIGIAFWGGYGRDEILQIKRNEYVAVAGLFVAALGVERLNELLIAPWVGRGDPVINRNVLVGSFGLLFGVTISASLGLSGQSIFADDQFSSTTGLSRTIGIFIAGLAIAGGGKPLHDLISRLEKNVEDKKAKQAVPEVEDDGTRSGVGSRQHRIAVDVEDVSADATPEKTRETLAKLLPGWRSEEHATKPGIVTTSTFVAAKPGTPDHRRQLFAAAHRVQSQKELLATPQLVRTSKAGPDGEPPTGVDRRWSLASLGLDATFYAVQDGDQELPGRGKDADGRVRVAVLDTGVRTDHPDGVQPDRVTDAVDVVREATVVPGSSVAATVANWMFDGLDFDVMSSRSHATSVASVIAAGGNDQRKTNTPGWWRDSPMIGVAPDAEIVSVRVMRGPVHLGDDDVARGVRVATGTPETGDPILERADVISMSLGGFGFKGLKAAIDAAVSDGVIVVCAAGNNFNVVVEPAFYGTTVAVAGTVRKDDRPFYDGSSRGPEVDIAAPGHQVPRVDFKDVEGVEVATVSPSTGTTYATAHISGVAALWLSHHGRATLKQWYPKDQLPRLFKYALRSTATGWTDEPWLHDNWGAGRVDVPELMKFEVFEKQNGVIVGPKFKPADLVHEFPDRTGPRQQDRIVGGIAGVLTGQGTLETRVMAVEQLAGLPGLLVGELGAASTAEDDPFRATLTTENPVDLPVPAGATPELSTVLASSSAAARRAAEQELSTADLDDKWGVGFSSALRDALHGRAETVKGRRYIGVIALGVAIAIAVVAGFADRSLDDLDFTAGFASLIGFFAIGVYAVAQGIERLLEFTVARLVYRGVPGREADRALILLGVGIVLGVGAAVTFDVGLIATIAESKPEGAWDEGMDAMVTGLAVGGGAKPVHDLLTRIRLPLQS